MSQVEKDNAELPLVTCFPQQLNKVFLNVLVNSVQAIEEEWRDLHLNLSP